MRKRNIAGLLIAFNAFIHTGLVKIADAQLPANTIQQPGNPAANSSSNSTNGQRPLPVSAQVPAANQVQGVLNGAMPANEAQVAIAAMGQAPFPPLTPELQKYLSDVLAAWERSTANIERYQCKFSRWQYDPTKHNDPNIFYTAASGLIRYMAPDKGMFQVEDIKFLKQRPDGKWGHETLPDQFGEWWICDGSSVHLYDQTKKHAKKYPLPPNMQGAEVFNSPLPFVFGVKAAKITERYWMQPMPHPLTADGKPNQNIIVLDAYPKFQADAVNYHHVSIYLDREKLLPSAIIINLPQWTQQSPHKEVFEFRDREVNNTLLGKVTEAVFKQSFIPKEPPKGWTVEEVPFIPEEEAQRVAAPGAPQQNQVPR